MNSLKTLSDDDLHQSAIAAARLDQATTLVTIEHLEEVARRFLHARRGYSSLQDYAENALGFSGPAAAERIAAMRLTVAVPETREKLKSGELSLSSAVAVQRFIYREEKASERRFTSEEKTEMIQEVSGLSVEEAKRALLTFAVSPEPHLLREKIRPVTPTRTELCFYANADLLADLTRVKELKGNLSLEEIFAAALVVYLEKTDPARKKPRIKESAIRSSVKQVSDGHGAIAERADQSIRTSESNRTLESNRMSESSSRAPGESDTRYVRVGDQRALHARSGGRCEFTDSQTGRRCPSRFLIRTDHRLPWALGGPTVLANLRHLCNAHNTFAAVEVFGMRKMKPFLRT